MSRNILSVMQPLTRLSQQTHNFVPGSTRKTKIPHPSHTSTVARRQGNTWYPITFEKNTSWSATDAELTTLYNRRWRRWPDTPTLQEEKKISIFFRPQSLTLLHIITDTWPDPVQTAMKQTRTLKSHNALPLHPSWESRPFALRVTPRKRLHYLAQRFLTNWVP